jgi:hypothetical protein
LLRAHLASFVSLRKALISLAFLAGAAGCTTPPTRKVETRLHPDAIVTFDDLRIDRDPSGALQLPIVVSYEYFQEAHVRVVEAGKPPLLADVVVLVNPPAGVEDRLAFDSTVNTTIVKVGEKGGSIAGPTAPVSTYPDPLEQLCTADGGPFALAPSAQGIVLVVSEWRAKVRVAGLDIPLRPAREGFHARSLPSFIEVPPGPYVVEVKRGAGATAPPYMNQVTVRPGEWRLIAVRIGDEGRRLNGASVSPTRALYGLADMTPWRLQQFQCREGIP